MTTNAETYVFALVCMPRLNPRQGGERRQSSKGYSSKGMESSFITQP